MKIRDPKRDPMEGDVVEAHGELRRVTAVTELGAVFYEVEGEERVCCIKSWQGWCNGEMKPRSGRAA